MPLNAVSDTREEWSGGSGAWRRGFNSPCELGKSGPWSCIRMKISRYTVPCRKQEATERLAVGEQRSDLGGSSWRWLGSSLELGKSGNRPLLLLLSWSMLASDHCPGPGKSLSLLGGKLHGLYSVLLPDAVDTACFLSLLKLPSSNGWATLCWRKAFLEGWR